ncbi:hypothetical protein [Alteromonas ponticola]|nr:hypothetical protein [Alteromonas ponticola]
MADNIKFNEPFNWWYFFAIIAVLVALPLMHIIAGWFTFWF